MTHPHNPIEIYQSADGQTQVEVRFDTDTVWLSQAQMVTLFGRDQSVISRHINNALEEGEIHTKSNMQKMHIVSADRPVTYYDLETVISVGYRIKSPQGVAFRRWATARLKDYLLKGYALNQQRLQQNAAELEQALRLIQKTAASPELTVDSGRGLVDIVSRYTHTFLWLQQYDAGLLQEPSGENGGILPSVQEARTALHTFKQQLIARGEATELFAREREDGFAALLGNLEQSIFGAPAIPLAKAKRRTCFIVVSNRTDTVLARLAVLSVLSSARRLVSALFETTIFFREESPFADGNKRSGAFLFVDFLHRNRRLLRADGEPVINDIGLAALTLLVADNLPRHKKTRLSVSSCTCCNHKERSPSIATVAHEWASERCRGQ